MRIAMNPVDRIHKTTHNMAEASDLGTFDRVAHSRIINGNTPSIKLMTGAHLGFASIVFIVTPSVINSTCSLATPVPVSINVHRMNPSLSCCPC
jgi:hypothetical protein